MFNQERGRNTLNDATTLDLLDVMDHNTRPLMVVLYTYTAVSFYVYKMDQKIILHKQNSVW